MPSETSFFDWTLFKKNVTRFWPIWASYLVIWLFALPADALISPPGDVYFQSNLCDAAGANAWFALFYGVICAMAVLSHLYSSKSANFYGALPVRREGIFLTQYVSGLSFTVIPSAVVAILMTVIGAASGIHAGEAVLTWLGSACGIMFFFYTLAFFCGLFAGHILALPAFYAIVNFICDAVFELAKALMEELYYGFVGFSQTAENAVRWLTPMSRLSMVSWYYDRETGSVLNSTLYGGWCVVVIYCAAAVILLTASFFLYRFRRLESAGDVVAVRFMRPVFKYGMAVCAGMFLGYITSNILGEATLPYTVVIWTVIGCFLAQMILDKSFRVFKKWRGSAVAGAVVAVVMACMVLDVTGFETWLPDPEDVRSVEVKYLRSTSSRLGDSGDLSDIIVTDPDVIENIITIHREAVEKRRAKAIEETVRVMPDDSRIERVTVSLTYNTRHAQHSRGYSFQIDLADVDRPGTAANALESIYRNRDFMWQVYGFDKLESVLASGGRIDELEYYYQDKYPPMVDDMEREYDYLLYGNTLDIVSYANILTLYEAVKQDYREGSIGLWSVDPTWEMQNCGRELRFHYLEPDIYDRGIGRLPTPRIYLEIFVPPTATHTLEALSRIIPEELHTQGLDENEELYK